MSKSRLLIVDDSAAKHIAFDIPAAEAAAGDIVRRHRKFP